MKEAYERLARRSKDRRLSCGEGCCEWWYDPSLKLWAVIRKDDDGYQVGESLYCVRQDLADSIETMAEKTLDEIDPYR